MRIDPDHDRRRPAGDGRAFVYVLPLHVEDLLKLGFSREPLVRMRTLHRRWFEYFDIERAFVVETERVREARAIERELKQRLREHRAPAPLDVRWQAGGQTEWYRGASATLQAAAGELAAAGWAVRGKDWLRERVLARSPALFEWALHRFAQLQVARGAHDPAIAAALAAPLRDELDALAAFGIAVAGTVPDDVHAWYLARHSSC